MSGYGIDYWINDSTKPDARRAVHVDVSASREDVERLVDEGYLVLRDLFSETQLDLMTAAMDRIAAEESGAGGAEIDATFGQYIRHLFEKDEAFMPVFEHPAPLSIARAVLGPQVWFGIEGRIAFAGVPGQQVAWHIHHRVIPEPLPPFFAFPHAIHCLLYLDDIGIEEGPIVVLPRSHQWPHYIVPRGDTGDRQGQVVLPLRRGDCLLHHANVWHKTMPSTARAGMRRLVLFGYTPSWIRGDVSVGVKPEYTHVDAIREAGDASLRELLGEFRWQPGG